MMPSATRTLIAALLVVVGAYGCDGPQQTPSPPPQPAAKPDEKKPVEAPKPSEAPKAVETPKAPEAPKAVETPKPSETPAPKPAEPVPPKAEEKKAETVTPPAPQPTPSQPPAAGPNPALLNPALATEKAPEKFKAKFTTTKGDFVIEVTRAWAPNGADRFYNLVKIGFLNDVAFFRNIAGFMVQFGINGDPAVNAKWRSSNIQDDKVEASNLPGYVTFAQAALPNSRSTQIFINFGNNSRLDGQRFAPFGQVVEGMNVVQSLYNGYGEGAPGGRGPRQDLIQSQGNAYLKQSFPLLDYVKTATIVN